MHSKGTFILAVTLSAALGLNLNERPLQLVPAAQEIPPSFFGMHMHHAGDTTPWPAVHFAEWRLWDAYVAWPDLEPRRDEWHFDTLDKYLDLAEQHHVGVLLVLGLTPAWASARPREKSAYKPGFAAEPKDLDDWRVYVRTVSQRYKERIQAYEIWNEPNLKEFWTGSVEQMVTLTRVASEVIRGVDPQAIVVSPSPTSEGGLKWLAQFLSQRGGQDVDVVGYHFYVTPKPPEAIVPLVHQVKATIKNNGLGDKPVWNTETGWSGPKPLPSEELAAAYLARAYILNWAAGVERLYWYSWDNHGWVALETTEKDNLTPTAAGKSYEVVYRWMVGARMRECSQERGQTWTCELERNGEGQWIIWNPTGKKSFTAPGGWHAQSVVPLLGEPHSTSNFSFEIGPAPVLVTSNPHPE